LRFISHFRAVHRGTQFQESKIISVRKLRPESWGFICPVHTPDGAPCGLLNHLSNVCDIVNEDDADAQKLVDVLISLGMTPLKPKGFHPDDISVMLDGKILGKLSYKKVKSVADKLRFMKVNGMNEVPKNLEIVAIVPKPKGAFPMLALFSHKARFLRPVKYLPTKTTEYIGPMTIAVMDSDYKPGITTHQELSPTSMLRYVLFVTIVYQVVL
jgi:DNA-directed RNA polymerase I subunit RPA2